MSILEKTKALRAAKDTVEEAKRELEIKRNREDQENRERMFMKALDLAKDACSAIPNSELVIMYQSLSWSFSGKRIFIRLNSIGIIRFQYGNITKEDEYNRRMTVPSINVSVKISDKESFYLLANSDNINFIEDKLSKWLVDNDYV